jgi:hypothetical protein
VDGEASEEGGTRGNGDGHVQGEPGLAGFWSAADEADGAIRPQTLDEPGLSGRLGGEPREASDREGVCHGPCPFLEG